LLADISEKDFKDMLVKGAVFFGFSSNLWTAKRLTKATEKAFSITVSKDTILRRLKDAGFSYQRPEKYFAEMDEVKREKWRRRELPKIRRCVAKFNAILYFEDEAHVTMATVLGKTWSPKGQTPKVRSTGQRGGVSAMSGISPRGDLVFQLFDAKISSIQVIAFLQQLLGHHKRRHLVVVMDQARPHVSKMTTEFIDSQVRLHVFYLPPYSPDYNPDEKVWNHLKHVELKNECFADKADLRKRTRSALHRMRKSRGQVRGIFYRSAVANFLR
jgi:transposase